MGRGEATCLTAAMIGRTPGTAEQCWCSRNDAIGNVAVMGAAGAVWFTASAWPDVIVAFAMAALAISGAIQISRSALLELRQA